MSLCVMWWCFHSRACHVYMLPIILTCNLIPKMAGEADKRPCVAFEVNLVINLHLEIATRNSKISVIDPTITNVVPFLFYKELRMSVGNCIIHAIGT